MDIELSVLNAARRMDQEALGAIFDRYAGALYNYAVRICGDPVRADQAVGDVFTKFLEKLALGKGPRTNLRSYLFAMTYNLLVDGARRSKREAPLEVGEYQPDRENRRHMMDTNLENKLLMDALVLAIKDHLTTNQRHVIVLRFAEGFSLFDTARIVGKQVNNVKVIQNRAIARLRKVLEEVME